MERSSLDANNHSAS